MNINFMFGNKPDNMDRMGVEKVGERECVHLCMSVYRSHAILGQ